MPPTAPPARARIAVLLASALLLLGAAATARGDEEVEAIDSGACAECHDQTSHGAPYAEELQHSAHDGLECLDCHQDRGTMPHRPADPPFAPGCAGCRSCHEKESAEYQAHGRAAIGSCEDIPRCAHCHGSHDVLPSDVRNSLTHPANLPQTCGRCHEDINLTSKYEILIDHPIEIYQSSVHGRATAGGVYVAATCNDCHSTGGSAHRILGPADTDSTINHFNIADTCGKCHKGVAADYWEGIHGQLARRGEVDVPTCTNCHGEHGILSPDDPRSPVSASRVAEQTCAPCHDSVVLNEKYGLPSDRLTTFVDSYHGLKSKAGDTHVANCASCHGVHRILPSHDPTSTIHPANLQKTCGTCHPKITAAMAAMPIHGVGGEGLRTPLADIVEKVYVVAIVVIVGLMVLHWLIDLWRQLRKLLARRPQVVRMTMDEVWQHTLLTVSFIVLVVSGFALRYDQGFVSRFFFGWEGGFQVRGTVHRVAAVVFIGTVAWHLAFLASARGRRFLADMMPARSDFSGFLHRILYNLGRRRETPAFGRFSYIEKAEYWALVWGTIVMIVTGLMLWFDNWFIHFLPKGALDIALVVHFWEAWLATLAILVWHLYSVVFNPHVYPMNPSWLTGMMPEEMYRHEHPQHLDEARQETEAFLQRQEERVRRKVRNASGDDDGGPGPAPGAAPPAGEG